MKKIALLSLFFLYLFGTGLSYAEVSNEAVCANPAFQVLVAKKDLKSYANMSVLMTDGRVSLTKGNGCRWENLVPGGLLVRLGLRSSDTIVRTNLGAANSQLDCLGSLSKIEKKKLTCLVVTGKSEEPFEIKLQYQ
ncbi:MAG: hypothetical protein ACXVBE_13890 [Bdellovibrionota bacterium]